MKSKFYSLTLIVLSIYLLGCEKTDNQILSKTSKKLESLKTVEYQGSFKNYYSPTGELLKIDSARIIFDFTSKDTILGAYYYISKSDYEQGFNGDISFTAYKNEKYLVYESINDSYDIPVASGMKVIKFGNPLLVFSIVHLKNILPQIIDDPAVSFIRQNDTIINENPCYQFNISMEGKSIDTWEGKIIEKEDKNSVSYFKLMINKKDYFPTQFLNLFEGTSPNWVVSYSDFRVNPEVDRLKFDYKTFNKDYAIYNSDEHRALKRNEREKSSEMLKGKIVSDWKLPSMSGDSVQLSDLNTKIVLLEFWFPYCTGCLKAVPELNDIQKTYKNKGVQVYGIEFQKADSTGLEEYIKYTKSEYPILYSGKKVALEYGVYAGPTIFVLNDKMEILYSMVGFLKEDIIEVIEKNL